MRELAARWLLHRGGSAMSTDASSAALMAADIDGPSLHRELTRVSPR